MTEQPSPAFWTEPEGRRLPRIALMGEFSAGKSTLANMMIGTNPLPVGVTATQMPPIWISYGDAPSVIVDLEGGETPCDLETLQGISPEDTAFIRFFCEQEILKTCELIDMPGISDPNMASVVWERILPFADGVLWCSPATQAWRQSEAAVWLEVEDRIKKNSLLVLTRADMLHTDKDKQKVLKRVQSEATDAFADVLMISLSLAREAGEDEDLWLRSGVDAFVARYLKLVEAIGAELDPASSQIAQSNTPAAAEQTPHGVVPRRAVPRRRSRPEPIVQDETPPDPMSFMPKFS